MSEVYLMHYGIKGQKWGIRRYQNEDGTRTEAGKERYSLEQYKRDRDVYGDRGARRIQKRVIGEGDSVSGARSREADRINSARKAATSGGQIGRTVGAIGGAIGGVVASKYVVNFLEKKANIDLSDPGVRLAVQGAVSAGASTVGTYLGGQIGRASMMAVNGYSPRKYR